MFSLPWHPSTCVRLRTALAPCQIARRTYSFESGRNRKPDRTTKSQPSNDTSSTDSAPEPKPVITGRGRRHRANSQSTSSHTTSQLQSELRLPFVPLPADHLAHLRPKVLSLDRFFSLQRPLLELDLPISERRSITAESRLDPEDAEEYEAGPPSSTPEQITTGSPSDPSFKPPQTSAGPLSELSEDGFEDEIWGAVDGYAPYLIAEPDGVDPSWSRALKHYLACAPAFVPPPAPIFPEGGGIQKSECHDEPQSTEEQIKQTLLRSEHIQFLAPYGLSTPSRQEAALNDDVAVSEDVGTDSVLDAGSLPDISQDAQSLTLQAARFLHAGLTSICWPSVVDWDSVSHQLGAAQATYAGDRQDISKASEVDAVRGSKPEKRNSTQWFKVIIEPSGSVASSAAGTSASLTLDPEQLKQMIEYSHTLVQQHLSPSKKKVSLPTDLVASFERLGAYLLHKHQQRASPGSELKISLSQVPETVHTDSVQRKRKRKMKVHKYVFLDYLWIPASEFIDLICNLSGHGCRYKKRRKAQRALRKRQGRD